MILELLGLYMFFSSNKKKTKPTTQPNRNNMVAYINYNKTAPANNNPGNLITKASAFKGGLYQLRNKTIVFDSMQNGVRALISNLAWYHKSLLPGLKREFTIKNIVKSWAPNDDKSGNPLLLGNDEGIYSNTIQNLSGIDKNTVLKFTQGNIYAIARAMCVQEHGLDAVTEDTFVRAWNDLYTQK